MVELEIHLLLGSGPRPRQTASTIPAGQETLEGGKKEKTETTKPEEETDAIRAIAGLTLWAEKRTVKAGESVFVPLWLLKARRIGNLNVEISYDPRVVRAVEKATKGNMVGGALFDSNPGKAGTLYLGLATKTGLDGDGTIAQMPFQAVGQPGQRSPLTLRVTTIHTTENAEPEVRLIHGEIEILTKSGQKPGDGDADGRITLADAMLALQMSIKLIPERLVCDADGDGRVTSKDARLLVDLAWKEQG